MKILIATGIYPPDIGGPATYSKLLKEELPKHDIEVEVLSFGGVRHLPKIIRHIAYFFNVLKRAKGVDVIFAQDPVSVGFPSVLAAKLLRKRFILKVVGDYAWEQFQVENNAFISVEKFQKVKFDFKTETRRKIQKFTAGRADLIITPSKYLKKIVGKWGIKRAKIKVVYNAVEEMEKPDLIRQEAKKKIGMTGDIILSMGRLVSWKGFSKLIEIMPRLLRENPNFKLIIIGDGPQKQRLLLQVKKLELQDKVFLVGKKNHSELPIYFRSSIMFVLNTAYEGLPHSILEAMEMEVPVIATDICGNPEVIKHNYNGFLIEYNNSEELEENILELWKDKKLQNKFIKNSKKRLNKFSVERMTGEIVKTLKQI